MSTRGDWNDPSVRHEYADVEGARLHYVEAGAGPLVLLVHGYPEFWYSWRHQIDPLVQAGFRVVAPDTRGNNLSSKPADVEAYREETLGRDIAQLVEALGAESAKVVGHDWGGWAAWWAAMLYPERVERLAVLNVPHPIVFAHSRVKLSYRLIRADLGQRWPNWMSPSGVSVTRVIFRRALVKKGVMSERELDRYVEAWRQPGGAPGVGAGSSVYTAQHRHRTEPIEQRCRPVSCPVLVIYGQEDRFIPAELATPPAKWVPNSRVELVGGSDHWVQSEQPERVTELLLGFLSE